MKEQILSALYEIIQPWACNASNTHAYVHPHNVQLAREQLKKRGLGYIIVIGKADIKSI
jgi:flagellar biosynthesis/type III secretory pathway protein FliH